jgi:hypothetical protein
MRHVHLALAAAGATLALAAPAGAATTFRVAGSQTVVNEEEGTYKMTGGLKGDWATTSFKEIAKAPLYRGRGTERFTGCLDRRGDGSCAGDPAGTLSFSFLYWAKFGPGDKLVWGSCWHPVTRGTGAFAGATGVLTMVDTPTPAGVKTSYIGNITLAGGSGARARRSAGAAAVRGCGPRG